MITQLLLFLFQCFQEPNNAVYYTSNNSPGEPDLFEIDRDSGEISAKESLLGEDELEYDVSTSGDNLTSCV